MKTCSRCGELLPLEAFYFASKKTGARRGQCKPCMAIMKALQKDAAWRPECSRCGVRMERFGPGRRLCRSCFDESYEAEARLASGAHRARLQPCRSCGEKRLRADHVKGTSLCGVCRSVPQHRRKRLRDFDMTPRDYLALLEDQGYSCWICMRRFSKQLPANVEHRHQDGLIRGLACGPCNTLLALAKDDPERLRGAAKFLESPPAVYVLGERHAKESANRRYTPMRRRAVREGVRGGERAEAA